MKNKPIADSLRRLLSILNDLEWHGGDSLGTQLGVSRAAVWKLITALKDHEVVVESSKGQGYRLKEPLILIEETKIRENLSISHDKILFDCFESVPSTNDYLMQRVLEDNAVSVLCIAEQQTHGKGRLGRTWASPFGLNVYMSYLWQYSADVSGLMGLSLVVGLSMVQALESLGLSGQKIKWPNDIYISDQKLAGVLIEIKAESNGDSRVVIGTGVNVNMSLSDGIKRAWTSCSKELGQNLNRNKIVAAYLNALIPNLELFANQGLSAFMALWNEYDYLKGKAIQLMHHDQKVSGTVKGINEMGALLMNVDGEVQSFTAGDTTSQV